MSKEDSKSMFPAIIFQNMVIMPGTSVHFDIQNKASVSAVNTALESGQEIFVAVTKNAVRNQKVKQEELYHVGTMVKVKQVLKLQEGVMRVLFVGSRRAVLKQMEWNEKGCFADVDNIEEDLDSLDCARQETLLRTIKDLLKQSQKRGIISNKIIFDTLNKEQNITKLIDLVTEAVSMPAKEKIEILQIMDVSERAEKLLAVLLNEIEISDIRLELGKKLNECVNKNQKEYVLREQLKVIKAELGEENVEDEGERYEKWLEEVNPPKEVAEKIQKEIKRFCGIPYSSSESSVIRNYIETVLQYPWSIEGEDNQDLNKAIAQLESDHYGLEKIKDKIIDYLAVRKLSNRKDAPILCLVGPPGTGKTSIAKSIASALHKQYGRIALGGVRDEAEIRGHRKTYVGAMPGRIVSTITKTGVNNPLILLDEVDKTGSDHKGDVSSALLEVLDGEQNVAFTDHYLEVPIDLSNVLFVATANDVSTIPAPLLDRMEIVEVNSYTENEKFHIASLYLLDKQRKKNGLNKTQFKITDEAIYEIIRGYTREAGVRKLEQMLNTLMQKTARGIVTEQFKTIKITPQKLTTLLGPKKYSDEDKNHEDSVGKVTGLAWTRVGGDTLEVEVNILDGKGGLTLTGNLGDVMKESAQIALSFVRTLPQVKKLPEEYFEKHLVHIHVPEGATPKDGPSAGITMALAIYSALVNKPVSGKIAMTGEVTLRGNVLPIGGLKEKLLAAKNAGMTKVLVPVRNKKDVEELEGEIIEGMEIVYVSHMDEVIQQGIVKREILLKQ